MASRNYKAGRARRVGSQGHKRVSTCLSENARLSTATAASLELDPSNLPASGREDFDITNDKDASVQESVDTANLSMLHLSSDNDSDTDDVPEHKHAPANDSTTVAEELEMHLGGNNAQVNSDDDGNTNPGNDPEISLTPVDCATLDVLKLCHEAGVSLEFYDIVFALLRKHSSKNKVDITKLPKRDTFLKSLRARISLPVPIVSQVDRLQVPHFDMLLQTRNLLRSLIFNNLNNLCVNTDPEQRHKVFVATDDDKHVEMCAQEWCQQTHQEFITDPQKQFLLPLMFHIDETGTDVFQGHPLEPLMFMSGITRDFIQERSSSWRHAGFTPKVVKGKNSCKSLQLCHECMVMVLSTLKPLEDNPPLEWL
jgi:hypothetical protein